MKENKGFTLIELLAVIVILAIIALIATPIILGIINDAKDSANARSVEAYGKSVETAVTKYMMSEDYSGADITIQADGAADDATSTIKTSDITYSGTRVVCDGVTYDNTNGTVSLTDCAVNGSSKHYDYSTDGSIGAEEHKAS